MKNKIVFRTYEGGREINTDFRKVYNFLVESKNTEYTYGRFDWMMTNWEYLEEQFLNRIGIWEEQGQIVAADLFDLSLGDVFPVTLPGYEFLYEEMLEYAKNNMINEEQPNFRVFICDTNQELQRAAQNAGLIPTPAKEMVARFDLKEGIPESTLPQGYMYQDLEKQRDYRNYKLCLFKGFGHEENGRVFSFTEKDLEDLKQAYERDYVDLSLMISVADSAGNYVAHTGMWYDENAEFALIEPVCTIPEARRRGIGRAAVLEGLRRVKGMGAKYAVVGSSQQFYYSIGFVPHSTGTFWIKRG